MSWKGVITNAGQQILSQWTANGHTLTIDGASVGSGYVDDINMRVATALSHEEATAAIVSADAVDGGTKFKVQISPAESTEYVAHEIGLWGHIDDGPRTLIALHQDSQTGINIPTKASSPDFIFALYLVHAISNSDTLTVNIDTSAVVSKSTMDNAIATAVSDASKTLNDKIVSNSEAISTNTNNISKNTADITALNNGLTNTSIVDASNGIGTVTYTVRGKLLELNAYWFGGSGISPGENVLLCTLPYLPVTWCHCASAYYDGVFKIESDGKVYFQNNTDANVTYAAMHEVIFIK